MRDPSETHRQRSKDTEDADPDIIMDQGEASSEGGGSDVSSRAGAAVGSPKDSPADQDEGKNEKGQENPKGEMDKEENDREVQSIRLNSGSGQEIEHRSTAPSNDQNEDENTMLDHSLVQPDETSYDGIFSEGEYIVDFRRQSATSVSSPGAFFVRSQSNSHATITPRTSEIEALSESQSAFTPPVPQAPELNFYETIAELAPRDGENAEKRVNQILQERMETMPKGEVMVNEDANRRRKSIWIVFLICGFFVLVAIVVVSVFLTRDGKSSDETALVQGSASPTLVPSSVPSASPTNSNHRIVSTALRDSGLNVSDIVAASDSPQNWVLSKMWDEDLVFYVDMTRQQILERYSVMVVLLSLSDSSNKFHPALDVNFSRAVCGWGGISCDAGSSVSQIEYRDITLKGTIATEIGLLENLLRLDLGFTSVGGSLPPEMFESSNLEYIDLSVTQINGTIPTEIGKVSSSLSSFLVFGNFLTGSLPVQFWSLTSLVNCNTISNFLSGTIPTLVGNLRDLKEFSFGFNSMAGTLPTELGKLSSLSILDAAFTDISGTIPTELGSTSMEFLYLDLNTGLNGSLPTELGIRSLKELSVPSVVNLSGHLPSELGRATGLESIAISNTSISGTIPSEYSRLTNLVTFFFSSTQLTGSVDNLFCSSDFMFLILAADYCEEDTFMEGRVNCTCCTHCCSEFSCDQL